MRTPGETVLITGASSGIGLEMAKLFAAEDCRLILVARSRDALEKLAAELLQESKTEAVVLVADLSLPETPKRIFAELSAKKIAVDVLVNNAGFGALGAFAELSLPRQLEMLQVNIISLTELTGLFLPGMIQRKRGGILNVGSVAGFQPGPGMAVYYATKAFVLSFTEALAGELAGTGLTISVLCPGPTETNFSQVARAQKARLFKIPKMSAQAVARSGHRAFRKGKVIAVPGWSNQMMIFSVRLAPRVFVRRVAKFYNRTED
jgi:short-subunit dehydrogenase